MEAHGVFGGDEVEAPLGFALEFGDGGEGGIVVDVFGPFVVEEGGGGGG